MKLQRKISAIFDRTIILLAVFAAILFVFMMLAVNFEVVTRYTGHPTKWVIDVTEAILLYIAFLGTAWLLKVEGHVKMDLILNRLKPRTQTALNIVTSIMAAIACLIITRYGVEVTWDHFARGEWLQKTALYVPSGPIIIIVPIGTFLLFIQFLRRTYGYLLIWRAPGTKSKTDLR